MKARVKWLKSPISLGFAKSKGDYSLIDAKLAEQILKESPGFLEIIEEEKPIFVKDTMVRKPRTRPVTRAKED